MRGRLLAAGLLIAWWVFAPARAGEAAAQPSESGQKVLHVAFRAAETGFDPALINDTFSRTVTAHIFEGLYGYDHLARPYKLKPRVADGLPVSSNDFKVWTVRIKPGIHFADDPAFGGRPRELVAEDFVYSLKRFFDPALKSPVYSSFNEEGFIGLEELRQTALKDKQPFNYDHPIEGVKALDRYTLQFTLKESRPRLPYTLAQGDLYGAVAREVIERYGTDTAAHPVGTGPFVLKQWRRSSMIVLQRNPGYREHWYDAEPAAEDAEGQALLRRFKGKRLPLVDRVEISVIEESQPRWLSFLKGEIDFIDPVPPDLAAAAVPNGKLAPNLAKQGIRMHSIVAADVGFTYFNMEDPIVGGYTPQKVALRRAIGLSLDIDREIRLVRKGQAIPAQSPVAPGLYGYDPALRTENSVFDVARAKALLDLYGYVDRDGDGWREQPDGSPLLLLVAAEADQLNRQIKEQFQKGTAAIGLRVELRTQQWPENLKASRAGKLMIWSLASTSNSPDGFNIFQRSYGPSAGGQNLARFKLDAFDRIYERMKTLPDGPERLALFAKATKLVIAYMPYKYHTHRIHVDLTQPWLLGYRRPVFWLEQWQYLDVEARPANLVAQQTGEAPLTTSRSPLPGCCRKSLVSTAFAPPSPCTCRVWCGLRACGR